MFRSNFLLNKFLEWARSPIPIKSRAQSQWAHTENLALDSFGLKSWLHLLHYVFLLFWQWHHALLKLARWMISLQDTTPWILKTVLHIADNTLFFIKICLAMLLNQLTACTRSVMLFHYHTNKRKSEASKTLWNICQINILRTWKNIKHWYVPSIST